MIDVYVPTTDGRELSLTRYTQLESELRILLEKLRLTLPAQSPPRITATAAAQPGPCSADLLRTRMINQLLSLIAPRESAKFG